MGQAKRRGSFEQRREQAVERAARREDEARSQAEAAARRFDEWWENATEAERQHHRERRARQRQIRGVFGFAPYFF